MPTTNLGKVSLTPKGEFALHHVYKPLDVVEYAGNMYIVKKECIDITPEEGEYYMLAVRRGQAAHFVDPEATATTLGAEESARVTVTASGTDLEKKISFEFAIPRGKNNYEIAKELGYEGTAEEWLEEMTNITANKAEVIIESKKSEALQLIETNRNAAMNDIESGRQNALSEIESNRASAVQSVTDKGAEILATIPEEYTALQEQANTNTSNITDLNSNVTIIKSSLANESNKIERNTKRISNIEASLMEQTIITTVDDSTSLIKQNPENVLLYASVDVVGGRTRKCRNLITPIAINAETANGAGVTVTRGADGTSVIINGTCTKNEYIGTGTVKLKNDNYILYGGNDTCYVYISGSTPSNMNGGVTEVYDADKNSTRKVGIYVISGKTYTNFVVYPMLEIGTAETATSYEPYFEGLRNTAATEFASVGANLFDINKILYGFVDSNGDLQIKASTAKFFEYPFKENTQYTFSATVKNDDAGSNVRFQISYTDGTEYRSIFENNSTTYTAKIFTSAEGKTIKELRVYYGNGNGSMFIKGGELMINEGSTALPYEPYRKSTLPIPEAVQALDGYGWGVSDTVYNYVDWEDDTFGKKVERVVLDGTEVYDMHGTGYGYKRVRTYLDKMATTNNSSVFSHGSSGGTLSSNPVDSAQCNGSVLWMTLVNYQTVDDVKAYISTQYANGTPLTVYYELAEPVITDISELLSPDNMIEVSEGGTVEVVTDDDYAEGVPTTITYQSKNVLTI